MQEHLVELMEDTSQSHYVMARDCYVDRNDTIKWKNNTKTDYTIHFAECPLQVNNFTVRAHGVEGPHAVKSDAPSKTYAYKIQPLGAAMAADPNVIVR